MPGLPSKRTHLPSRSRDRRLAQHIAAHESAAGRGEAAQVRRVRSVRFVQRIIMDRVVRKDRFV